MAFLPTDWITAEKLFSFGTVLAIMLALVSVLYLMGASVFELRLVVISATALLNLVLAVLRPPLTALSIVLAVVNSIAMIVIVILAFEKVVRPQLKRYRKT